MTTVDKVKALCKSKKVSFHKLEMELGFANGYIGQLKRGSIPIDRVIQIASFFGVDPNDILGDGLGFGGGTGSGAGFSDGSGYGGGSLSEIGHRKSPPPSEGDGQVPSDFAAIYNQLSPDRRAEVDRQARLLLLEQQTQIASFDSSE